MIEFDEFIKQIRYTDKDGNEHPLCLTSWQIEFAKLLNADDLTRFEFNHLRSARGKNFLTELFFEYLKENYPDKNIVKVSSKDKFDKTKLKGFEIKPPFDYPDW